MRNLREASCLVTAIEQAIHGGGDIDERAEPAIYRDALGLLGVLQFVTAVVAVFVPLAAGLYLVVTVTWTLVQRLILRRKYPVELGDR